MKRVGAGWAEGGSSHKISLTILTMLHSHVSVCRAKFFWFCNVFTMFTCSSNVCVQNPDPVYIFWHITSWSNRACKICKSCMWFLVSPCLFKKFWDQRCLLSWTFQAFVIATMVILKRVMCFRICVLSSFSAVSFLLLRCCVFSIFHHVMCFRSVSRAFVCASSQCVLHVSSAQLGAGNLKTGMGHISLPRYKSSPTQNCIKKRFPVHMLLHMIPTLKDLIINFVDRYGYGLIWFWFLSHCNMQYIHCFRLTCNDLGQKFSTVDVK